MKTKKTTHDGWDCSPELMKVAYDLEDAGHLLYELRNCQRTMSVEEMVYELRYVLSSCINQLDEIDTDVKYITEYEDD